MESDYDAVTYSRITTIGMINEFNCECEELIVNRITQLFKDPSPIRKLQGIKVIIFDINTLAYLHSFKANKKMSKENIYHTDTLYVLDMFGGRDRIERIKEFFEIIQEIGIKLTIVSLAERSESIGEALRRVQLFNYFKNCK